MAAVHRGAARRAFIISLQTLGWLLGGGIMLVLAGVIWLVSTPSGSQWAIAQASRAVAGLSVQSVQGSLISGLRFEQIQYHDATGLAVRLQSAALQWDWRALWQGRLEIRQLDLHSGLIALPAAPPADQEPAASPMDWSNLSLHVPFAIKLAALNVTDVTLMPAVADLGETTHSPVASEAQDQVQPASSLPESYHLAVLQAQGEINASALTLAVQTVKATLPQHRSVELAGQLHLGIPVPHLLGGQLQALVSTPQGWLSNELQLGGSLAKAQLGLTARWDGVSTPSAALTATAALTPQGLALTSAHLDTLNGSLCSTGEIHFADGLNLALQGRAEGFDLAPISPAANGRMGFGYAVTYMQLPSAAANQIAPEPNLSLKINHLSGTVAAVAFDDLSVDAVLANQVLGGSLAGGTIAGGTVQAAWRYGLSGNQPITLSLAVAGLSLGEALSAHLAKPVAGNLSAELALDGDLGANAPRDTALKFSLKVPQAQVSLASLLSAAQSKPFATHSATDTATDTASVDAKMNSHPVAITAQLEGAIANQTFTLAPSVLAVADTQLRVDGQWGWQANAPANHLTADLTVPELSRLPWAVLGVPPVSGKLQITTQLAGSMAVPRGTVDLSAQNLAYRDWQLLQLKLQSQIGANAAGAGQAQANLPFKLSVQANDLNQQIVSIARSSHAKQVPLTRWLSRLNIELNGSLPSPSAGLTATQADAPQTAQSLRLTAQSPLGNLSFAANGHLRGQAWRGVVSQFHLANGMFERKPLGSWRLTAPVEMSASPTQQALALACFDGVATQNLAPAKACFAGARAGERLQGRATIDSPIATLLQFAAPWLPPELLAGIKPSKAFPGAMNLVAAGGIEAGKLSGTLKIRLPDSQFSLPQFADGAVFSYQKLGLDAELTADTLRVNFAGDVPKLFNAQSRGTIGLHGAQPLNISTQIHLPDLSALAFLAPQMSQLTGKAQAALQIGGGLAAPKPSGSLAIHDLAFALPDTGVAYDQGQLTGNIDGAGQLKFDGQLHGVLTDTAALAGGSTAPEVQARQLRIEGTGDLAHLPEWQVSAQVTGTAVPVLRIPSMKVDASPDVTIEATQAGAKLGGTLSLPLIDARIEKLPEGVVKSSDDLVIVGAKPAPAVVGYPLTGDIQVMLGDAVTLKGMGFSTGLSGGLDLRLRPQKPLAAFGEIDLKNGQYKAYGQDLSISQGRLLFVGPLDDPGLSVTAQRKVDSTTVGLKLGGTLYHPKTTVFSNPTIPESDALSLLLTGRRLNDGSAADGSVLLNAIKSLGIAQGDDILRDVGQKFGFDSVGLDTTGGLTGARLSVGKKIGDRLLVRYAIGVLTGVGEVITEYQLNRLFSIEITSSPVATGGDVIYRIR
jgi:translocation and assembly module TamB